MSLWQRSARWGVFWLISVAFALTSHPVVGQQVRFFLVPEDAWLDGKPQENAMLASGTVYLYRSGDYHPSQVLEVGRPQPIAPGTWHWIAESPGYVTIEVGALSIREEAKPFIRNIVWPVVPACTLRLGDTRQWQGITRIDFVSLGRNAVYPVSIQDRSEVQIPAGAYLLYTVTARGLGSISPVQRCEPQEVQEIARPDPPSVGFQHIMVSATVPEGHSPVALTGTLSGLPSAPLLEPASVLRTGRRVTFFFRNIDATRGHQLLLQHPQLLTSIDNFDPLGGSARELSDRRLRPRLTLEIPIDYQPARSHQREELTLSFCGRGLFRHSLELDVQTCRPIARSQLLTPGLHTYRFDGLDTGQYLVDAWIDDQRIVALGNQITPTLEEDSSNPWILETQHLKEFHIYGHLLEDGEPVAGEVRLEPRRHWDAPVRRFLTDDDKLYHIYYFAEHPDPFVRSRLPQRFAQLSDEQLLGSFQGYTLIACDDAGFCRPFHRKSTLSGGGRLDIDLGSRQQILVTVVEAETGDPIPEALVTLGQGSEKVDTFHFAGGEAVWNRQATIERLEAATDILGMARLRGIPPGLQRLVIIQEGYRWYSGRLTVPDAGELTVTVQLERSQDDGDRGILFHHADGQLALRDALIALDPAGKPFLPCSRGTGQSGRVELPPSCLETPSLRFLFLGHDSHPALFSTGELRNAAEVEVSKAEGLPLTLKLIDETGTPAAYTPVQVRLMSLGGLLLTPDILLAGTALSGVSLPFTTDGSGRLTLPFLGGTVDEEPRMIDADAETVITLTLY